MAIERNIILLKQICSKLFLRLPITPIYLQPICIYVLKTNNNNMKTEQAAEEFLQSKKWAEGDPSKWVQRTFIAGVEHAKNNLTTKELDAALRMAGIHIHRDLLDKVIDVAEVIIDKGGDATIKDIEALKLIWKKDRG